MTGYLASFHSLRKNKLAVTHPNTIKHMTVAESQGWATPPNSNPRSSIRVPPTIVKLPSQSMALRPSHIGVVGVSSLRKIIRAMRTVPEMGTAIL